MFKQLFIAKMGSSGQAPNTLKAAIARNIIPPAEPLKMWLWALTIVPTCEHTSSVFSRQGFIIHLYNTPTKPLQWVPATADNQNNSERGKKNSTIPHQNWRSKLLTQKILKFIFPLANQHKAATAMAWWGAGGSVPRGSRATSESGAMGSEPCSRTCHVNLGKDFSFYFHDSISLSPTWGKNSTYLLGKYTLST